MATPLFIGGAAILADNYSTFELSMLGAGLAIIMSAQADGWGRQMDLGSNDKPDNETGHRIRDWFFKAKSSFARDLVGLYMRMSQFLLAAVPLWFAKPELVIIPVGIFLGLPILWVIEHIWIKPKGVFFTPWNKSQPVAWVEWMAGIWIFLLTLVAIFA